MQEGCKKDAGRMQEECRKVAENQYSGNHDYPSPVRLIRSNFQELPGKVTSDIRKYGKLLKNTANYGIIWKIFIFEILNIQCCPMLFRNLN